MIWRTATLAVLALIPAMALVPGLADEAGADEEPLIPTGPRAFVLEMQSNEFNRETWPNTPMLEAYEGEQMHVLVAVPPNAEMHTFHLHGHPWQDPDTGDWIDAVRLDAGETHRFEQTAGLGQGNAGDWFYHCHVGTHFGEGMWGLLRVYPYAMSVTGELDALTVTLHDDEDRIEDATFDARLRQGPDQVTGATVGEGDPVEITVTELGDGRYEITPELPVGATGELVLESHHATEGESVARLDLTPTGYALDRDVTPSEEIAGLDRLRPQPVEGSVPDPVAS